MNNNNNNRFFDGLILGAVLGGAAVFLLGTRSGRNILKIVSEQGLEGITNVLEEYDLAGIDEELDENLPSKAKESHQPHKSEAPREEVKEEVTEVEEEVAPAPKPKKRFFRRK